MNDSSFLIDIGAIAIVMSHEVSRGILEENIPGLSWYDQNRAVAKWAIEFVCSPANEKPDRIDRAETYARLRSHETFDTILYGRSKEFKGTSEQFLKS